VAAQPTKEEKNMKDQKSIEVKKKLQTSGKDRSSKSRIRAEEFKIVN